MSLREIAEQRSSLVRLASMDHLKGVAILGLLGLTGIAAISAFVGTLGGLLASVGF